MMSRFLLALAVFCASLSLAMGAVAHAAEPIACIDATTAQSMGHSPGDSDEVPADSDKGYPHHHGGCQVHQQAVDRVAELQIALAPDRAARLPLFSTKTPSGLRGRPGPAPLPSPDNSSFAPPFRRLHGIVGRLVSCIASLRPCWPRRPARRSRRRKRRHNRQLRCRPSRSSAPLSLPAPRHPISRRRMQACASPGLHARSPACGAKSGSPARGRKCRRYRRVSWHPKRRDHDRRCAADRARGQAIRQNSRCGFPEQTRRVEAAIIEADLRMQVTQSYIAAISAERRADVARQLAAFAESSFRAASTRVTAGAASPIEQQRAEVARVNARVALETTLREVEVARANLGRLIGQPVDGPLDALWFERVGTHGPREPVSAAGTLTAVAAETDVATARCPGPARPLPADSRRHADGRCPAPVGERRYGRDLRRQRPLPIVQQWQGRRGIGASRALAGRCAPAHGDHRNRAGDRHCAGGAGQRGSHGPRRRRSGARCRHRSRADCKDRLCAGQVRPARASRGGTHACRNEAELHRGACRVASRRGPSGTPDDAVA